MSMIEPPDPDDLFLQIMDGVTLQEPSDTVDYTQVSDMDLARAHSQTRSELFKLGALTGQGAMNPTGRAAELHSRFMAINAEMRRRWPRE